MQGWMDDVEGERHDASLSMTSALSLQAQVSIWDE